MDRLDEIFEKDLKFDQPFLPPAKRAAYSDRTAHLIACLSQAAYFKFEGEKSLLDWAKDLMSMRADLDEKMAQALLEKFQNQIR